MFFLLLAIGFLFGIAGNTLFLPFKRKNKNQFAAILFGGAFYSLIALLWLGPKPALTNFPIEQLVLSSAVGYTAAGILTYVTFKFLRKHFPDPPRSSAPPSGCL